MAPRDPSPWDRAARTLRAPIPEPAKPTPRKVKTWHRLKPGQRLRSMQNIICQRLVPSGSIWIVDSVSSEGAKLSCDGSWFWQTDTNWEASFARAKAREAPRRKKNVLHSEPD